MAATFMRTSTSEATKRYLVTYDGSAAFTMPRVSRRRSTHAATRRRSATLTSSPSGIGETHLAEDRERHHPQRLPAHARIELQLEEVFGMTARCAMRVLPC